MNSSNLGDDWTAGAHLPKEGHPDNTTHYMVQWNAAGGPMRCRYCKRTDVTTQEHCEKAPQ